MDEIKLKPCPFCGGEAHMQFPFIVRCSACGVERDNCGKAADAISDWNRRTDPEREAMAGLLARAIATHGESGPLVAMRALLPAAPERET